MMARQREYEKLPGRGMRRGAFVQVRATFSRLWLAKDHLLMVDSNGFSESYKRFFFRDIQAITVTRTKHRMVLNIVLGCFLALFLGCVLAIDHNGSRIIFGSLTAIVAVAIVVNCLRGPGCRCLLTTAVQTEELASLRRAPQTRKILARLQPLILEAQEGAAAPPPQEP